jgi:hypothetical protein
VSSRVDESSGAARWRLLAASVPGRSHEASGTPCQDAHAPSGPFDFHAPVLAAAVADGAGRAEHAQAASAFVVEAGMAALRRHAASLPEPADDAGWQTLLRAALAEVRAALEDEVARRGADRNQFSTTLILLLATPGLAAAAQIGDGASVIGDREGNVVGLTVPDNAGFINATMFVLSPDSVETAQVAVWRGELAYVALMTDGLDMIALKMPEARPHAPFFAPLFRFIGDAPDEAAAREEFLAFLHSPRLRQRTHDDVTLLLATLEPRP